MFCVCLMHTCCVYSCRLRWGQYYSISLYFCPLHLLFIFKSRAHICACAALGGETGYGSLTALPIWPWGKSQSKKTLFPSDQTADWGTPCVCTVSSKASESTSLAELHICRNQNKLLPTSRTSRRLHRQGTFLQYSAKPAAVDSDGVRCRLGVDVVRSLSSPWQRWRIGRRGCQGMP